MFVLARLKEVNKATQSKLVIFIDESHGFEVYQENGYYVAVSKVQYRCPYTVQDVWEIVSTDVNLFARVK